MEANRIQAKRTTTKQMERWSSGRHKDYRDKKLDNGREGQLDLELTDAAIQNLRVVRAWEEEKEIFVGFLMVRSTKKIPNLFLSV